MQVAHAVLIPVEARIAQHLDDQPDGFQRRLEARARRGFGDVACPAGFVHVQGQIKSPTVPAQFFKPCLGCSMNFARDRARDRPIAKRASVPGSGTVGAFVAVEPISWNAYWL